MIEPATDAPKRSARGGRREGAGRKKTIARTVTVGLPQDAADIFAAQPKKAAFIAEAIRYYAAYLERQQRKNP